MDLENNEDGDGPGMIQIVNKICVIIIQEPENI